MFSPLTSSAWMAGLVYEEVGQELQRGRDGDVRTTSSTGLYTVKNLTDGGLLAGLTYTKDDKERTVDCFWETNVEDGKWVAVNGLKPTCIA